MALDVALTHDYLTQRGGAERVVLSMLRAFPGAPLHTSLYQPKTTFPEFSSHPVHPSSLNQCTLLRQDPRRALPFLAWSFGRLVVDAEVVLCSSSGWAHGAQVTGRKVVYCYTPARWLYQTSRYLGDGRRGLGELVARIGPALRGWDQRAALSADRYLTSSTAVRDRIREVYGIEACVIPPPHNIDPFGSQQPIEGLEPGFVLSVCRLRPYKNVDAVVDAFTRLPDERLVVVGDGPDGARLRRVAPPNVRFVGRIDDARLRWLYANCRGLVAASYEDFGLTPLEAASFGAPSVVLRWGGFLDTVVEGETGVFFDRPTPADIAAGLKALLASDWDAAAIRTHAEDYSEDRFIDRLRSAVGVSPQAVPQAPPQQLLDRRPI